MNSSESPKKPGREWVARGFTVVEDVVYIGLGLLLAVSSISLLVSGLIGYGQSVVTGSLAADVVRLLDRILLILLFVELLYTVQVSFREHAIVPEPFILVALIAVVRRVLVLTAELPEVKDKPELVFNHLIIELGVLTILIVILVVSLYLLGKRGVKASAERATEK